MKTIAATFALLFAFPYLFTVTLSGGHGTGSYTTIFAVATAIVPIALAIFLRNHWTVKENGLKPTFRLILFIGTAFAGVYANCRNLELNESTFIPNLVINVLFYAGIAVVLWWLYAHIVVPQLPADFSWLEFLAKVWKKVEPVALRAGSWVFGITFILIIGVFWILLSIPPLLIGIANIALGVMFTCLVLVLWIILAIVQKLRKK